MVRHSAAHRKAEELVFPTAAEHGTGILTFSNTCYGRLMNPTPVAGAVPPSSVQITAADCYRYTLAQPAVTACWTAPATLEQLDDNLQVLDHPQLDPDVLTELERRGQWLYEEETLFRQLIRER